jgi:hypothetical protein
LERNKMKKPHGRGSQEGPDVEAAFDTWRAGYAKLSVEQVMSIYDPGVMYTEPCYPAQDFEKLASWYKFDFARSGPRPTWKYQIETYEVSGTLAIVVSRWVGSTDAGTRVEAEVRRLRSIDIFKLGISGWKIVRTINDPEPCLSPLPKRRPKRKTRR